MSRAILIMAALRAENRRQCIIKTKRRRRNLRNGLLRGVLELSEAEFSAHYRLTKKMFLNLCNELRPQFIRSRRRTKVSVECKVLVALSFYATGSYQKPVGMRYLHGLSQASVSNAVREVTRALNHVNILQKYIRFPQTQEERRAIIHGFYTNFGIPGVLGCIDGTHVALVKPTYHEERFFNRKHYYSRNVQIICDSDLNILNVDASFGGAAHDAYIWRQSELNTHMQQLYLSGENVWFIGNSGYPLRPWLLTPIPNAVAGSAEENYTKVLCLTRNTIERCIGVLKARWRCLLSHRVLHYNHHIVADIINACSVLHNIANRHRLPVPELTAEEEERNLALQVLQEIPETHPVEQQLLEEGYQQQQRIVERLWADNLR